MPHEHNLLHHAAVNILKIRESKVNPYELYACFLDSDCSPAAEELFTRLCWNKLVADCPEIGKIIKYREGFIGKHLSIWVRKGNNASWTPKMKRYSVGMMEGAITALEKENRPAHTMWQPTAVCWKYGMTKIKASRGNIDQQNQRQ